MTAGYYVFAFIVQTLLQIGSRPPVVNSKR
jgi:hypothetical protein